MELCHGGAPDLGRGSIFRLISPGSPSWGTRWAGMVRSRSGCANPTGTGPCPPSPRSSRPRRFHGARRRCAAISAGDRSAWRSHDAVSLIEDGARLPELLIEQGTADPFLAEQLKPELLRVACDDAGIALTLNLREGYDHSYYFISTFMKHHLRWHAARLASGGTI